MKPKYHKLEKAYGAAAGPIFVIAIFSFHVWLAFFFFRINIAPVAILSILSCVAYLTAPLYRGENFEQNIIFLVFCEIAMFSLLSTVILSLKCGFFLYALPLPLSSYIEVDDRKRKKFLFIATSVAMFLMAPLTYVFEPLTADYRARMEPYNYMFLVGNFIVIVASYITNVYVYMRRTDKQAVETKYKSEHDALTGMYNRNYMNQYVKSASKRGELDGALIMFDIDNFKLINDEYGHDVGDAALKKVSSIAKSLIREDDIPVRWGGEEFVIYIKGLTMDKAVEKADEIRAHIASTPYYEDKRLTISLGVTVIKHKEDFGTAMKRADANMYEAKTTGKNKVVAG